MRQVKLAIVAGISLTVTFRVALADDVTLRCTYKELQDTVIHYDPGVAEIRVSGSGVSYVRSYRASEFFSNRVDKDGSGQKIFTSYVTPISIKFGFRTDYSTNQRLDNSMEVTVIRSTGEFEEVQFGLGKIVGHIGGTCT